MTYIINKKINNKILIIFEKAYFSQNKNSIIISIRLFKIVFCNV